MFNIGNREVSPIDMLGGSIEPVGHNLKRRRDQAEKHLADLTAAIELLKSQPKLLETLELLRRVGI